MHVHRREVRAPALDTGTKFAAFAVLLLATGVAACTVMFSVVQAVLLRPYNIESPARVVVTWPVQHDLPGEFAYNAARDLRRLQSLESVASVGSTNWFGTLTVGDGRDRRSSVCGRVGVLLRRAARAPISSAARSGPRTISRPPRAYSF